MSRTLRFACAVIVGCTALLAFPVPAGAFVNDTFGLTPHPERVRAESRDTFNIPLEPGAVFEDSIRLFNRTDQPIQLVLFAADAEASVDKTISVGSRGSDAKGVGTWIKLDRGQVTLPPRGELTVPFRVEVRSTDPLPKLGAIVAENSERGLAADFDQQLHLLVRTDPPNTPTTSARVRPFLLSSPWIIVAILGLVIALVLVAAGTRRGRRPRDTVVAPGELDDSHREAESVPKASKPVLRHLGAPEPEEHSPVLLREDSFARPDERGELPLLDDDLLVTLDSIEETRPVEPAVRRGPRRSRSPARTSSRGRPRSGNGAKTSRQASERTYIPLDDL